MVNVRVQEGTGPGQARILICDDAASVRALLAAYLGREHRLELTATAEEALAIAPAFAPDLVLTDLLLPGMSGRDLIARLRSIPAFADVPMVLFSAMGDSDARAGGLEAGADDYLVKPIRERELLARVRSLLRLRRTVLSLSQRTRALEEANHAVQVAQERLARSERLAALGSLAAALAHDINNPLSLVSSGASALSAIAQEASERPDAFAGPRLRELAEELRAVSAEVAEGSRRLQAIGRDLRLFGASGGDGPPRTRVGDALEAAVSLARARAASPPGVEVEGESGLVVAAPHHLLTLALQSILDRALQSAGASGHVRIEVQRGTTGAEIAVHDDGPRIPDALLPRIFEPFAPSGSAARTPGLGLSVAAGIILGLGGHVDVDASPAFGACFRVHLPLAE